MNLSTLREIATITDPIERARVLGGAMAEQQGLVEEAARMRRQAIAEARARGHRLEEIAGVLGVSPGRISQMRKGAATPTPGPAMTSTLEPPSPAPQVIVHHAVPEGAAAHGEYEDAELRTRRLGVGREPSSEHVATCLRVRSGDEVIARRHLVLADDVPVRLVTSYFRADLFDGTPVATPAGAASQAAIEALGHTFGHVEETLVVRPAAGAEAETLALDPEEWVVQLLRASYSTDDVPVRVTETACAARRHVFTVGQAGAAPEF